MSSSGLAAVILNFRLPVASESIGATTVEKFDVENGGRFLNFVPSWYRTGDSPGIYILVVIDPPWL